ncbi:hypothetical protein SELMODRAFT_448001 [Selaginella moellendorffii]|uniref:Uncharacterized protein n=1 Tax=Selaginella moellendorffii TaxID=88036 RepID=D8T431_SELML|nr:uncharacterized protein LOC9631031 [Selaginella moellendorffii]EFJ08631.1 hypothetical protein SELMODRAFT_448001 [Selaginella moellendorffii]|eukprot:XP_002990362.1 uncharacterized protein LOC9631031 [Selaginella moellendorffii]
MIGSKNIAVANATIHHRLPPNAAQSWEHDRESCGESRLRSRASSSPSSTLTSETSNQSKNYSGDDTKEEESMDTAWTDDRHSSYLSSMEEMFVRNMYDREYCAVDICGEAASSCDQDCVESRPLSFFKVMQGGGWQPLPCRRLHSWELPSPNIFSSPWVRHFTSSKSGAVDDQTDPTAATPPKAKERLICRTSTAYELEDDVPEVPDVENRASVWLERISKRSTVSSTGNSTADTDKRSARDANSDSTKSASQQKHHPRVSMIETIDQVVPLRSDSDAEGEERSCKLRKIVSSSSSSDRSDRIYSARRRRRS